MSQPIWQTPAGSLGTVPQGVYYRNQLNAVDPELGTVTYQAIAGTLPDGIQFSVNGLLAGVLAGVPTAEGKIKDTEDKFTVRAYSNSIPPRIADRTFSLTVTGNFVPVWITPVGQIASYYTSQEVNFQFEFIDTNPNVIVQLAAGSLPGGLRLSPAGLLTGYVQPPVDIDSPAGYEETPQDTKPYDFIVSAQSTNYQFSLEITDGVNSSLRTFTIFVYNRQQLTADDTIFTADNTFITADETTEQAPFITNSDPSDLGLYRSDNYYAYQFIGENYTGMPITYALSATQGTATPPGLALDPNTGWLYGYIPNQGATETSYAFNIAVYQTEFVGTSISVTATTTGTNYITCNSTEQIGVGQPIVFTGTAFGGIIADPQTVYYVYAVISATQFQITTTPTSATPVPLSTAAGTMAANLVVASRPYPFDLTITGPVDNQVVWLTASDLGTIVNGSTSILSVVAEANDGTPLHYRLKSGAYNQLPQGLELLPSGDIVGRVSFDTFALDLGATTFDKSIVLNRNISSLGTTFDSTFIFTINAFDPLNPNVISVFKTFTVKVFREYNRPYQNLYIKAMPPQADRAVVADLLADTDIFVPAYIYRPTDPNFGKSKGVNYIHAYGLAPDTLDRYVESLYLNHYWKNLILGEISTARAVDPITGEVIYEVIYSKIIDTLVNNAGQSVSKIVTLPYAIDNPAISADPITSVYPNSLVNMRDQVIDLVGQISTTLPLWMTSKQSDGRVLGFTPAWVMCYTTPGRSNEIAYLLNTQFTGSLNQIDFKVDRYELDRSLSKNWDTDTQRWTPTANMTTFDKFNTGGSIFIGTVDFGATLAFSDVQGRTRGYINDLGGLDGVAFLTTGQTVIFTKQQNFDGPPGSSYATADDAFQNPIYPFDSYGFDQAPSTFDESVTVPGGDTLVCTQTSSIDNSVTCDTTAQLAVGQQIVFDSDVIGGIVQDQTYYVLQILSGISFSISATEGSTTPVPLTTDSGSMSATPANQRMAIYTINVDPISNIVSLTFTTQTEPLNYVQITRGQFYRSAFLFYPTSVAPGFTRIAWLPLPTVVTTETIFDKNSLQFVEPVDMYIPEGSVDGNDVYDKYLVFPKSNILV